MAYQSVFQRYEIKYLITQEQKNRILLRAAERLALDRYGRTSIRNIYFDTDSYRLIRHSIEKPAYKEKLRLRSYQRARNEGSVFVELKKKYRSVVYKRRMRLPQEQAMSWATGRAQMPNQSQIAQEIDYFLNFYQSLQPKLFLSYEREAYFCKQIPDFRVTFDDHICCRQEELTLDSEVWGEEILTDGMTLMEIKCAGGIPLWMSRILSEERIYKTSFSKYGICYQKIIFPNREEKVSNV